MIKKNFRKNKIIGIALIAIVVIFLGFLFKVYFFNNSSGFSFSEDYIKVSLKPGEKIDYSFNVFNDKKSSSDFSARLDKEIEIISFSNSNFKIEGNEKNEFKMSFNIPENAETGVILGKIQIISDKEMKEIPYIIEIQSKDVLFDAISDISPKGDDLILGQKLTTEISLLGLAEIGRREIKIDYYVKNFEGETALSESENKFVNIRADYSKTFDLKNSREGEYVFFIVVNYNNSTGISSSFFNLKEKKDIMSYAGVGYDNYFSGLIIFGLIFFLLLGVFIYYIFTRDRLFMELQREYKREINMQRNKLNEEKRTCYRKLKNPAERRRYAKKFDIARKRRIGEMRKIYYIRVKEYKHLKKHKKKMN